MNKKRALLLLPNLLGEHRHHELFLPVSVDRAMETIDGLIAESEKEAKRYLSRFQTKKSVQEMPVALLNEHTPDEEIDFLLEPMVQGERWGLISDAGVPCVADPGSKLVARARQLGISIRAFIGPSSLLLALMLSGLPAQRFYFRGYLGRDSDKRKREIRILEQQAIKDEATQLFIEAPYRNQHMLEALLEELNEQTMLCVAWDLTLPTQGVVVQPVKVWKRSPLPNIHKKPAVFLVAACV